MKFAKILLLALSILMLAPTAQAADVYETGVTVTLDGAAIDYSGAHEPVIKNGRTLVPMRKIFEAMGAEVSWNESDMSVTASKNGAVIEMRIGAAEMNVSNGDDKRTVTLEVPPELLPYDSYADTTMVPLRAVSESFGYSVNWDENNYLVSITTPSAAIATEAPTAAAGPASETDGGFDPSDIQTDGRMAACRDKLAYIKDDGTVWYLGGGQVPGISRAVRIALGKSGGYALTDGGEVYAWGTSNEFGQLGSGTASADGTAKKIEGLKNITKIAAGADFGLALSDSNTVYAWGRNNKGQLGNGGTADSADPVKTNLSGAADIAAGDAFGAAVTSGGNVYTWGENSEGQLGRGTERIKSSAEPAMLKELLGAVSVSAGPTGAAAVRQDKSVYAWGTVYLGVPNDDEEVMYHDKNEDMPIIVDEDGYYRYDRPRRIPYLEYDIETDELVGHVLLGVDAVSCGEYQYAALSGGKLYMWGRSPAVPTRLRSQKEHYYAAEYKALSNVKAALSADEGVVYALAENGAIIKITYGKTETVASVR